MKFSMDIVPVEETAEAFDRVRERLWYHQAEGF